jgi:catechol 2,3-dioxygenase-like lactoylglutathione lyase family enzyme
MRLKFAMPSLLLCCSSLATTPTLAQTHPRPRITGISHLAVYATDMKATDHYYADIIGAAREPDPENPKGVRYAINATQFVEVLPLSCGGICVGRLDHTGWNTDNAGGLRRYLTEKGWKTPATITHNSDGSKSFRVDDPEGNLVEFVEPAPKVKAPTRHTSSGITLSTSASWSIHERQKTSFTAICSAFAPTGLAVCKRARSIGFRNKLPTATTGSNTC